MKKWTKTGVLAGLILNLGAPAALAKDAVTRFEVKGMVCESCARDIRESLSKDHSIKKVTIDIKTGMVTVTYRDHAIAAKTIAKKMESYGFDVKITK